MNSSPGAFTIELGGRPAVAVAGPEPFAGRVDVTGHRPVARERRRPVVGPPVPHRTRRARLGLGLRGLRVVGPGEVQRRAERRDREVRVRLAGSSRSRCPPDRPPDACARRSAPAGLDVPPDVVPARTSPPTRRPSQRRRGRRHRRAEQDVRLAGGAVGSGEVRGGIRRPVKGQRREHRGPGVERLLDRAARRPGADRKRGAG